MARLGTVSVWSDLSSLAGKSMYLDLVLSLFSSTQPDPQTAVSLVKKPRRSRHVVNRVDTCDPLFP